VLAALLIAAPATAQEPPEEDADGVTCEPANPAPASTTDCTASGLAPSSAFEWSAQFTDGSTSEGTGTADTAGIGTFMLEVPDVPTGAYQLSVTGTASDDSDYDEGTQGLIVPASEDAPSPPEEDAPEDDGGNEEPPPGDDGSGVQPAPDTGTDTSGQVSSAPAGGVATGAGGTAGDGSTLPLVALTALLLAIAGHVVFRVRSHAVRDR
jgi:hypothetical protein